MSANRQIRAVVVDDEAPARRQVVALLSEFGGVVVVEQCRNGRQAIEAIQQHAPDLVFLDIQMPGMDGFRVIEEMGVESMPAVIFVTAYDRYAVRAFDVHAVDYLLKPYSRERFAEALQRVKAELGATSTASRKRLRDLLRDWQYHSSRGTEPKSLEGMRSIERLVVRAGTQVVTLRLHQLIWVEAADHYVYVHVKGNRYLLQEKLSVLEATLPAESFVRIHRGAIVNISHVAETSVDRYGSCFLRMTSGERLRISRRRREALRHILTK